MDRLRTFLALSLACFALWGKGAVKEKYDKHVIIVVDQSLSNANNDNMLPVYESLCKLLQNQEMGLDKKLYDIPDDFHFDPNTDEISAFGFALSGEDYYSIVRKRSCGASAKDLFDQFSKNLIQDECSFQRSGENLNDFLKYDLRMYFTGMTPLHQHWRCPANINAEWQQCGLTFSHYVFPIVLRHVDATTPSSQFLLFIVSDFQSGAYGEGDIKDEWLLSDMVGKDRYPRVLSQINALGSPFVRSEYIDFRIGSSKTDGNRRKLAVRLMGYKLLMKKTVQKSPIFITSGISPIEQINHEGTIYRISPVIVLFNKDENTYVRKVNLKVTSKDENAKVYFDETVADSVRINDSFDEEHRTFVIDHSNLKLDLKSPVAQPLKFEYTFYTISKDDAGNDIMPYILTASRDVTEKDFDMNGGYLFYFIMDGLIVFVMIVFLYFIWKRRAKSRKATLKYRIDGVSKMRYMDVKDDKVEGLHVVDCDCWYIKNGETETNIHVRGDVSLKPKFFAKKCSLRVMYMVRDLDQNTDFTFRPAGKDYEGKERSEGKYYEANTDSNGHFELDVVACICKDPNGNPKKPNFEKRENILKMGLFIKVEFITDSREVLCVAAEENNEADPYCFIVKPDINNKALWMAFDPGTTGSCVAYGYGGTPDDMTNIHLAKNYVKVGRSEQWNPIFPSCIAINDTEPTLKKVDEGVEGLEAGHDFLFGNAAYQQEYHVNRFQSIKKLLGYSKTRLKIYDDKGGERDVSGSDLAHLIIKGLVSNFERFIIENEEDTTMAAKGLFMPKGKLEPSRAIVAVPNNYTLTKVRDMVDSIKRTHLFKEVHYLYEAEGVMMSYLGMNWKNLHEKQDKVFVVFDMGGATINITAFGLKVNLEVAPNGNTFTRDIDLSTVSKVGYCVGGDDIDFAIMHVLYNIPQIKSAFGNDMEKIKSHQKKWKPSILKYVQELKLDLVDRARTISRVRLGNVFVNKEVFWTSVTKKFEEWGVGIPAKKDENGNLVIPDDFWNYIQDELNNQKTMKQYVLDKVRDAVMELMNNTISNSEIELIFSGRSTLYPGIEEAVLREIRNKKYGCTCKGRWDGFDNNGILDAEKVKTAVVKGACWYALWSGRVNLKHDLVTSTFGYIDMVDNERTFVPVVERNMHFESNGKKKVTVDVKDPELSNVKFIQMLGGNYTDIIKKSIKYKMNPYPEVTANDIKGRIEKIQIEVDDKNNFSYQIVIAGQEPVKGHYEAADTDILDENSEAYAFAAIANNTRPVANSLPVGKEPVVRPRSNRRGGGL